MEVRIRRARPDDAAAMLDVLIPIIAARIYTAFDTPFSLDAERAFIENLPPRGVVHVAVSPASAALVGFQTLDPFAAYTHAFDHVAVIGTFVDLRYRRQGIATRLFQETLPVAVQLGFEKLFTFVRADNPAALETYRRHGFETVGTARRQARVDGRYIDEIIIEKLLVDAAERSGEGEVT